MIAERLGLLKEYTGGKTIMDYKKFGFQHCGCGDMISWEKFVENGYFVVPTDENWEKDPPGFNRIL